MATGLFSTTNAGALHFRSRKISGDNLVERRLNEFADQLARHDMHSGDVGGSVRKVCKRMGISVGTGNRMMKRLRADLGPQADG